MAEEDPLSWLLELDSKLDGALAMIRSLEQIDGKLKGTDQALKGTENASKKMGDEHERHKHKAHTLTHELEELNKKLHELTAFQVFEFGFDKAIELGRELLHLVAEITTEAVNAAAAEERTAKSFKLQLGQEQGDETLKYLDAVAHHTEFSRTEMKGFAQDLIKAGFSAEQLPHALAATADMAAFSKDRIQGAQGALESLARIQRTGRVMERALAPLGIGEDKLIEVLKKRGAAHGDKDSIKKQLQKGEIDRGEVLQAVYQTITDKTGKALGGAGVDVGKGLQARLNRLKNLPEEYFEKWADSPGFAVFSDRIDQLFKKLDPDSPEGKKIFSALEGMLAEVTSLVDKLLTPEGLESFTAGLKMAFGVLGDIVSALKSMIDLLNGETLSKMFSSDAFGGRDASERKVNSIDYIRRELERTDGKAKATEYAREQFAKLQPSEREDLQRRGAKSGFNYGTGIYADIDKIGYKDVQAKAADAAAARERSFQTELKHRGIEESTETGKQIGDAHLDGVRQALDAHSPSRKMAELGRFAALGFREGAAGEARGFSSGIEAIVAPSMQLGPGSAAGRGGPIEINIPIEIAMHGGSAEDAEAVAERVREILPSSLQSALEQLRMELGA